MKDNNKLGWSARRINYLGNKLGARCYLEIGVNYGHTFRDVDIEYKTGVDPKFRFDFNVMQSDKTRLLELTSDQFFLITPRTCKSDIIFIDGLHVFEQALRDFTNSLVFSHDNTVWIIDDVIPNDIYSSIRSYDETLKLRALVGNDDLSWHGDVYKVVHFIHDFFPSLNYRTINTHGNYQTIVWKESRSEFAPIYNSLEEISRLDYVNLINNQGIMNLDDEQSALEDCITQLIMKDSN